MGRAKYEWVESVGGVKTDNNGFKSGQDLVKEHTKLASEDNYKEKHFQEAIEFVLAKNDIEYKSEKKIKDESIDNKQKEKRADIYIPKTDTVIELKLNPNCRGVGQVAYYSQMHHEAILMVPMDQNEERYKQVLNKIPGCHYAAVRPGVNNHPIPQLAFKNESDASFFDTAEFGRLGDDNWFININPLEKR